MELLHSSDFEVRTREPRILFWDIETAANKGYVWGKYQQDVIEFDEEWYVLAWSVRYGRKQITKGLQDYEGYRPNDPTNDLELMKDLHSELSKADLFVYHNGDAFDLKKANTRFIEHGLAPIAPKASVDTLKVARRLFKFNSNKLDDLARRLGLERKMQTGGFELWKKTMQGDAKAFNRMKRYCAQDVRVLEQVYYKLRPYIRNHPHLSLMRGNVTGCSNCGGTDLNKEGFNYTRTGRTQQHSCKTCGAWMRGKHEKLTDIR
jgi:DNA polymerase III epsilon subunit-like protein